MRRRGSTIAECLFTMALCVIVVTAGTLLYSHTTSQTLDSVGLLETGDSTDRLAKELDFLIGNALDAEVKTIAGRTVLKLTMPYERGARDANGFYDSYPASFMHPRIGDARLDGERIWIYCGTNDASINTAGTIPLLARRVDDATPSLSDVDWLWTYRDGAGKNDRRSPGTMSFDFSMSYTLVSWAITSRSSSGSGAASIDSSQEATFRDVRLDGATLLQEEAPL